MYCKNCGKEIKDGMRFCPRCGKPVSQTTGGKKRTGGSGKKKPDMNKKLIAGAAAIVVVILAVVVGSNIVKKDPAQEPVQITAADTASDGSNIAEDTYESQDAYEEPANEEPANEEPVSEEPDYEEDTTYEEPYDSGMNDPEDAKWADMKAYQSAYEEEYASFEETVRAYCEQSNVEYMENVDELAGQFSDLYEDLNEEIPGLSDAISADIASNAGSFTGFTIIDHIAGEALASKEVRETALKGVILAAGSAYSYLMDYTTTDYPFGFEVYEVNGDYALIRSNGTYNDFYKTVTQSLSYNARTGAAQDRIRALENEAVDAANDDEYAAVMGRIAANRDREAETETLLAETMTTIACGGVQYCEESTDSKLYMLTDRSGTVLHAFWMPGNPESWDGYELGLGSDGSLMVNGEYDRFVSDRNGNILFEGNAFWERQEEPVGESVIYTHGPEGVALRETKVKDDTYGTYFVLEVVRADGESEEVLKMRDCKDTGEVKAGLEYGGERSGMYWKDSVYCSNYARVEYIPLENEDQELTVVINLESAEVYPEEEFMQMCADETDKTGAENAPFCEEGSPRDGWVWFSGDSGIYEWRTFDNQEEDYSTIHVNTGGVEFNQEALMKRIGETRELTGWYCKDDLLWVFTRSGLFYTYDLKNEKKNEETEVGENAPYRFTPYGLLVCRESTSEDGGEEQQNTGWETPEYSVYQYNANGEVIHEYSNGANDSLSDSVFGNLFCNGRDTYNLETGEVFSLA